MRPGLVAGSLTLLSVSGCGLDPVHDDQVRALGPESESAPRGPYHRAGQPCTVCHGGEGPAETTFVLAGTVFTGPSTAVGVGGVELLMVDALGSSPPSGSVITNCVGNFYVSAETWNPAFPVRVAIVSGGAGAAMVSHIGRAGSCAQCHTNPPGLESTGYVYLQGAPATAGGCPVNPALDGSGSSQ
jgi:hypothetical protein